MAYGIRAVVGVLPLLVFNAWAFGSPFTLSYTKSLGLTAPVAGGAFGRSERGRLQLSGSLIRAPRLSLLVSEKGLLIVTPLAVAALLGRRAEAPLRGCGSSYEPGLLYLRTVGRAQGRASSSRPSRFSRCRSRSSSERVPSSSPGSASVSVGVMAMATITGPLTGVEYSVETSSTRSATGGRRRYFRLARRRAEVGRRLLRVLLALACGVALARVPLFADWRRQAPQLAGDLVAPDLQPADKAHETDGGAIAVLLVLATIAIALHVAQRSSVMALLVLAPALRTSLPRLEARPRLSLLVALAVLGLAAFVWQRLRPLRAEPFAELDNTTRPSNRWRR